MPLGDNSALITTANTIADAANGTNDVITATSGADAIEFTGNAGKDSVETFGKDDSILNYKAIFDGNGDGIIDFGPNGVLDIDRVSAKNAGADQITLIGEASKQLRYLGTKDGEYVYADASVKLAGFTEGTVGDNTFDAGSGAKKYFYDTALGLNLGGDTITNFGADDLLITTSLIYNGPDGADHAITMGFNKVLDLPSSTGGAIHGDDGPDNGGQINLVGVSAIYLEHTLTQNGVTYYEYGTTPPPVPV